MYLCRPSGTFSFLNGGNLAPAPATFDWLYRSLYLMAFRSNVRMMEQSVKGSTEKQADVPLVPSSKYCQIFSVEVRNIENLGSVYDDVKGTGNVRSPQMASAPSSIRLPFPVHGCRHLVPFSRYRTGSVLFPAFPPSSLTLLLACGQGFVMIPMWRFFQNADTK